MEESRTEKDIFSEGQATSQRKFTFAFWIRKKEILDQFDINQEVLCAEFDFRMVADLTKNNSIRIKES